MKTDKHGPEEEMKKYKSDASPSLDEIEYIKNELKSFNDQIVGDDCHQPLAIVYRDDRHEIAGGIIGGTIWGWLYIDRFWVREDCRESRLGDPAAS